MGIIIDTDSHFTPQDVFDDEEARRRFGSRWPRIITDGYERDRVVFRERERQLTPLQRSLPSQFHFGKPAPGFRDDDVRVEWMDGTGVDMQVLLVPGTAFAYATEPQMGAALTQSINNAIARVLQRHPGRFIGLALIPMQDQTLALEELDRAVGELGIHAPLIVSNVNGRNLSEPEFWPFYQRLEELGVPLIIHGSRQNTPGPAGIERLEHMHLDNALGFMYEGTLAISCLILYGVLDRFPRLRVGVLETGAGYLPHLMERLQVVYDKETFGGVSPLAATPVKELVRKSPEEYMDQIWLNFDIDMERRSVPYVVGRFGADRFMVSSDYPHGGFGGAGESYIDVVRGLEGLTGEQKELLLGGSACALFGIDPKTWRQVRGSVAAAAV